MKKIYAITYESKQEDIVIHPTGSKENEVIKKYYDHDGNLKKQKIYDATDVKLINRRATDIQDYFYNLVENNNYMAHYE
jgi:hypothetical protein